MYRKFVLQYKIIWKREFLLNERMVNNICCRVKI